MLLTPWSNHIFVVMWVMQEVEGRTCKGGTSSRTKGLCIGGKWQLKPNLLKDERDTQAIALLMEVGRNGGAESANGEGRAGRK